MRSLLCLTVCVFLFSIQLLRAELSTFQFSGRIQSVFSSPQYPQLPSVFQVGRPYTLSYTFDLSVPDAASTSPSFGFYPRSITAATFSYDNSTYVGNMDRPP
jgi:hypothetical protein